SGRQSANMTAQANAIGSGLVGQDPEVPAEASSLRPREGAARPPGLVAAIRDPVVVILLLAGIFDGLAGNVIHSILLVAVGLVLGREVALGRGGPAHAADMNSSSVS